MEHKADKVYFDDYILCTCGTRYIIEDFREHCRIKNAPPKTMECVKCHKIKHVNDFATPDECNECFV